MNIEFCKYQGAGNDFVMLDNFSGKYDDLTLSQVTKLCDRKFGIGADGLIKINKNEDSDFEMEYFNADGTKSFCGNGARCSVRFVNDFLLKRESYSFEAIDGTHSAIIIGSAIHLEMKEVQDINVIKENTFEIFTGSPHYVFFSTKINTQNMVAFGKSVRFSEEYKANGINVNLVEILSENQLAIRTYERGVEDETLSCGTGITAAAIAYVKNTGELGGKTIKINALGGDLAVKLYAKDDGSFGSVELIGPAEFVFKGTFHV